MTIGSRRRITRETLFEVIPEYAGATSKEAAERMFERDKVEILQLGLDLRSEADAWDESVVHYRIARRDDLPALDVTPAEYTVLLAASRAWDETTAGGAARRVRAKLLSLGQDTDPDLVRRTPQGAVESLPVLAPLLEAVTTGRTVSFRYRAASGQATERRVEPWVVGVVDGRWYVLGHDLDRDARRLFRASRIESFPHAGGRRTRPVPRDASLAEAISGSGAATDERAEVALDIVPFKALALRDTAGADVETRHVMLPDVTRTAARRHVLGSARWVTLEAPAAWREELRSAFAHIADLHAPAPPEPTALAAASTVRPRAAIQARPSSTDHLSRLISEAAYVLSRGEVALAAMAAEFGIDEERLVADLQILFVCGDLGAGWEDLIDVEWEDGWVRVRNADALDGPLRLTAAEVTALLAGLAALTPASGDEASVVASARRKLAALVRDDDETSGEPVRADAAPDAAPPSRGERIVAEVQRALAAGERTVIRYSPPDRPGTSVRRIRPLRLETTAGRAYLRADDETAGGERTFRLDRIVEVLGVSADVSDDAGRTTAEAIEPSSHPTEAWLRLEPSAAWIAEAFDAAEVRDPIDPERGGVLARLDGPVRSALLDAVMEAAGAAELLAPGDLRDQIVTVAREAECRHEAAEPVG